MSCRQHTYGSCFHIHSASLCLLVGTFRPFKVTINMYVLIAILLFWICFCRSFLFPFFFCDYMTIFSIVFGFFFILHVVLNFWLVVTVRFLYSSLYACVYI